MIGGCSNTFFNDSGFRGAIVSTLLMSSVNITKEGFIIASAGTKLSQMLSFATKSNLGVCPELFGIPGSVGGAIRNNAGAFGKEIADVFLEASFFDLSTSEVITLSRKEMKFSYRNSIVQEKNIFFLCGKFKAYESEYTKEIERLKYFSTIRKEKQPQEPSLGSYFKKTDKHSASELIDRAGLKGYSIGGARVSPKHAGFIVNYKNASTDDIIQLAEHIKQTVSKIYGINLDNEAEFQT